jgi:3',5'-cyclic AMP phosphodiesterase CpdA
MGIRRLLLFLGIASQLVACPSGYRFARRPGEPTLVTPMLMNKINALAEDAIKQCPQGLAPLVHCDADPALCNRDLTTQTARDCRTLRPLLTFAHLSDAQLKEELVALDGPVSTRTYDSINGGSARNPDLERHDSAVLLATVLGINHLANSPSAQPAPYAGCAPPLPPRFVLHTGDSVDAGLFSELYEMLGVMSLLDIPFYNVVGNHDNLFFGTFPKARMKGLDVTLPFVPIGSTERFIAAHHAYGYNWDISIPYTKRVTHTPTARGEPPKGLLDAAELAPSFYHGFDLFCQRRIAADRICPEARGYYRLDVPLAPLDTTARELSLLVLNTAEIGPEEVVEGLARKARGQMREEQYLWLMQQLASRKAGVITYFIVAGHHDIPTFIPQQRDWLLRILLDTKAVLAYVDGHTHVNAIHSFARPNGPPLWEITVDSTLVFPQLGQLIELLEDTRTPSQMFLRVRSFRQRLSDSACATDAHCNELAASARIGRAGAHADKSADGDWREESYGVQHSNGMLPLIAQPP